MHFSEGQVALPPPGILRIYLARSTLPVATAIAEQVVSMRDEARETGRDLLLQVVLVPRKTFLVEVGS